MRKVIIVLVAGLIGFMLGALVVETSGKARALSFCSGNKYLAYSYTQQAGYVTGVSDAFFLVGTPYVSQSRTMENAAQYSKCIGHMTPEQIQAIVEKFLIEHPEQRHYSMASIIWNAVTLSCPE